MNGVDGRQRQMCIRDGRSCRSVEPFAFPLPFFFAFRSVVRASTLGPRSSLTDMFGSTGSSHNQHRQLSCSPMSSTRAMVGMYVVTLCLAQRDCLLAQGSEGAEAAVRSGFAQVGFDT